MKRILLFSLILACAAIQAADEQGARPAGFRIVIGETPRAEVEATLRAINHAMLNPRVPTCAELRAADEACLQVARHQAREQEARRQAEVRADRRLAEHVRRIRAIPVSAERSGILSSGRSHLNFVRLPAGVTSGGVQKRRAQSPSPKANRIVSFKGTPEVIRYTPVPSVSPRTAHAAQLLANLSDR